jgi:demethylmenaquinone methyltransferase/2-methoxy-6-polyprenyl-1,4-benzoquinol methylase
MEKISTEDSGAVAAEAKFSDEVTERKQAIQGMFNAIAHRYDLLNHLLSAGIDVYWRRRALGMVRQSPRHILDLATGTGDFALAARRLQPECIVGADVALAMVRVGVPKVAAAGVGAPIHLLGGDAEGLPFRDESFDLVTAAFGVRNFGHIPAGLAEARRVLRPGGELLILDFAEPTAFGFRQCYRFYFKHVLPRVGGWISGNRQAYTYLPHSVGTFPQGEAFLQLLVEAGFTDNRHVSLTLGISAVYQGIRR